jgi:hypothetical protein
MLSLAAYSVLLLAGGATPLVDGGQAKAVLVTARQPTRVVAYAAQELVDHVEKATGVKLDVVEEGAEPAGRARVYLGPTEAAAKLGIHANKLAPDSFVLRSAGGSLVIAGRDGDGNPLSPDTWAGTLFGVYEILGEHLGVRWLWPGELGEFVPRVASLSIPDLDRSVTPRLVIRRLRSTLQMRRGQEPGLDGFSPKALAQVRDDEARWLRRHRMGHSRDMHWGHAFTAWWEEYGRAHPEWFNLMDDGRRRPQYGNDGSRTSMCVSNAGFQQEIIRRWLAKCAARPDNPPNINGCENDVMGRCGCPACKAWDPPRADEKRYPPRFSEYGIVSDRYARFWRTLQELAARHDPEAIVAGYAYVNYAPPPVREKLNDHVWIGLVPDSFFPRSAEAHQQCREMWDGWARTGCRLFLRPNYTLEGYCMPFLYVRQFADEFAHCARHGMIATDFDSLTAMWAAQGPQTYLMARWQSCLDRPVDEVLAEYYSGFGPAAAAVKAYFDYWEDYTTRNRERFEEIATRLKAAWSTFPRMAHECFTPDAFAGARRLLVVARQAAGGDPACAARVEFLEKGLVHAEKCVAVSAARALDDLVAARKAIHELRAYRHTIERDNVANLAFCESLEQRAFRPRRREVLYDGPALHALVEQPAPTERKAVSLRGEFGLVALLRAGESLRVTITAKRVGRNAEPLAWTLVGPNWQKVAQGQIALKSTATITQPASTAGLYNLVLKTSPNAADVILHNDHAAILGKEVSLIGASGPMWFYVPPKAKQFQLTLSSPSPGETAKITIFDPDGHAAASADTGERGKVVLDVKAPAGARGKAWSLVPERGPKGVMEDYTLGLGPGLPACWSQSSTQLLVPEK